MILQSFDGATDPMQGWYSSGYGFKQPSWALQFERHGTTSASFATLLATGPYASQDATVTEDPGCRSGRDPHVHGRQHRIRGDGAPPKRYAAHDHQ